VVGLSGVKREKSVVVVLMRKKREKARWVDDIYLIGRQGKGGQGVGR
jgi:hypothetical protein